MKLSEVVSRLGERYVEEALHEGGDTLVGLNMHPSDANNIMEDFATYIKHTVDADVSDEVASRGDDDTPGGGRLHVLTEEEYCTVFDFINAWGPSYLDGLMDWDDFESYEDRENHDAMMEALRKLLKRMVKDRGDND